MSQGLTVRLSSLGAAPKAAGLRASMRWRSLAIVSSKRTARRRAWIWASFLTFVRKLRR